MEKRMIRSLGTVEEPIQGLALVDGRVWVASSKMTLRRLQENAIGGYRSVEEIGHNLDNLCGLAWTGSEFMVSDKTTKAIYKIDPLKKTQDLYLDLIKLKSEIIVPGLKEETRISDVATSILKAEGAQVSAMAFNKGKLWLTVEAGYSSSMLVIDDQTKNLVDTFYTRGPKPQGITFEKDSEKGWVLDGSNKEVSQFETTGKWTSNVFEVPLKKPFGLTLDKEGNFVTADLAENRIYRIDRGGIQWKNTQS